MNNTTENHWCAPNFCECGLFTAVVDRNEEGILFLAWRLNGGASCLFSEKYAGSPWASNILCLGDYQEMCRKLNRGFGFYVFEVPIKLLQEARRKNARRSENITVLARMDCLRVLLFVPRPSVDDYTNASAWCVGHGACHLCRGGRGEQ